MMIMTATAPAFLAAAKVELSHAMLAMSRPANSSGSGLVSHRLLQEPEGVGKAA